MKALDENLSELDPLRLSHTVIKKWLRRGELKTLAKKHKISASAGYKALTGDTKNFEFLKECYQIALDRALTFKRMNEKLQSIKLNNTAE